MSSIGSISGLDSGSVISLTQQISSQSKSMDSINDELSATATDEGTNAQGVDALKKKMDSAISEALKKLDKTASAEQIMQTIKSAAEGVMKSYGIDPEAMKGGMRPPAEANGAGQDVAKMPPPPQGGSGGNGGNDDFMAKIESLLLENGFDVEKFKSELAATKSKNTGNSDLSLLNNLNSSQGIDTQA